MLQNFLIFLAVVIGLVGLVTLGFAIPPRPFRPHPAVPAQDNPSRLPLSHLPQPVQRHFAQFFAQGLPEMHTAVLWGRGRAKIRGVWLPLRFKTWVQVGRGYYTRMEITWFMRPVMRASESFRGGIGARETGGKVERGAHIDQANRMFMWANSLWVPAVLLNDPSARWEAVDDNTARLVYDAGDATDSLLFHFDPQTGCATHISGLRYGTDIPEKDDWRVDLLAWKDFSGITLPCHTSISWGEAGSPWSYWNVDGVVYNAGVSDHLGE